VCVCVREGGAWFSTNPGQPVKQSSLGWRDKWSEQIEGWSEGEPLNPVCPKCLEHLMHMSGCVCVCVCVCERERS